MFFLFVNLSIAIRVIAIGVKHSRDDMDHDSMGNKYDWSGDKYNDFNRQDRRSETLTKLEYYESKYQRLTESTSLLDLRCGRQGLLAWTMTRQ